MDLGGATQSGCPVASDRMGTDHVPHASTGIALVKKGLDALGPLGRRIEDAIWSYRLNRTERLGRSREPVDHVRRQFRAVFGRDPDLETPRTFNEKIQYLKLYDRSPLHTRCADKIAVREYVKECIPETDILIPLLAILDNPDDLRPETITAQRFVAKASHDSGSTQICRDRDSFDWARCRRRLRSALRRDYSVMYGEWQYRDIPRRIVVEELIETSSDYDYKLFCFHGKPHLIMVNIDRFGDFRENFYDTNWAQQDIFYTYPSSDKPLAPPATLNLMLDYAARLSAPFAFARIDFYEAEGRVYFGEITFHQSAGLQRFVPESIDLALGARLTLPPKPSP